MSDQGSIYKCRNHPLKRWFDTKPNGKLIFAGEFLPEGETIEVNDYGKPIEGEVETHERYDGTTYTSQAYAKKVVTFKRGADAPEPFFHLKCRIEGKNAFAPNDERLNEEPTVTTIEDVRDFLAYVDLMSKTYSFDCPCTGKDLVRIEGATYESEGLDRR